MQLIVNCVHRMDKRMKLVTSIVDLSQAHHSLNPLNP